MGFTHSLSIKTNKSSEFIYVLRNALKHVDFFFFPLAGPGMACPGDRSLQPPENY